MFIRNCPKCGKEVRHNSRGTCDRAIKNNTICMDCECLRRRTAYLGTANPFYGKKHKLSSLHKMKTKDMSYTKTAKFRKKRKETSKKAKTTRCMANPYTNFGLPSMARKKRTSCWLRPKRNGLLLLLEKTIRCMANLLRRVAVVAGKVGTKIGFFVVYESYLIW